VGTRFASASLVVFSSCLKRNRINPPHTIENASNVPREMMFVNLLMLKQRARSSDTTPYITKLKGDTCQKLQFFSRTCGKCSRNRNSLFIDSCEWLEK